MAFLQILTTFSLFGLIWVIQLVHYPAFRFIADDRFPAFHRFHTFQISLVVLPLMLVELAAAIWLAAVPPTRGPFQWVLLGLTLLVWLSTFALQVPCHSKLGAGKDDVLIDRLVHTNWLRTLAWSLKTGLLGWSFYFSHPG
ncbi:MAG: hypothetical protein QNK37_20280 [Acidobacteriota bacterium]|nr:hypothetical protein [Acidobacteriota bacterium]